MLHDLLRALPPGAPRLTTRIAAGLFFIVSMALVTASRAEPGACCNGDACTVVSDASECQRYRCNVTSLLPETFAGCYGDADGNGFVNAGDRGFVSANIGQSADDLLCRFDMDGNGVINAGDRGIVAANIGLCSPLPDWQDGSGMNHGAADPRFAAPVFGAGLTCAQVRCGVQACDAPRWAEGFHVADLDQYVSALTVFDDGTGAALYAGGHFSTAGRVAAGGIAKWDGTQWSALIGPNGNGMNERVEALVVFDDGTGPALYAGGWFTSAGGNTANYIAKWNGTQWSPLSGPDDNGMNQRVEALTVFDDGTGSALYAAGWFTVAGGVTANYVAKWNGTQWAPLSGPNGNGMNANGRVHSLTVFDDGTGLALYAGGGFSTAGGVAANRIAKWDGTQWSALAGPNGTGMSYSVNALAVFDDGTGPALYAGGEFTMAGGIAANRIAKWDGTQWSAPGGLNAVGMCCGHYPHVEVLTVFDDGSGPALFAGGRFTAAESVSANYIAKWDGTHWSPLDGPNGNGMNTAVFALTAFDDGMGPALYAGGWFTSAGGVAANHIARWDVTQWSALSTPGGNGLDNTVNAFAALDDGTGPALYAGGWFSTAGGVGANWIAEWDGMQWSALTGPNGYGLNYYVTALNVFDDGTGSALYAGGPFSVAGGVTANYIAKWNGTQWSALRGPSGSGMNNGVQALAVFDDGTGPALYAGGYFTTAGGIVANHIAKWDGTNWSALTGPSGNGVNDEVYALAVFDDGAGPALFAGGDFTTAGGVAARRIARWNGTQWSALTVPLGLDARVQALAVFDDGTGPALYAGGAFATADGIATNGIAKWDGAQWSALAGPSGNGMNSAVRSLTVFDDRTGPALYAGGYFTTAGGVTANYVAKWDGSQWSALTGPSGNGTNGQVLSLTVFDDGTNPALYAGGHFTTTGGVPSAHIARWGCAP